MSAPPPALPRFTTTTRSKVELTGDEEEEDGGSGPQRLTVGIDDIVRVLPWFCIEVWYVHLAHVRSVHVCAGRRTVLMMSTTCACTLRRIV